MKFTHLHVHSYFSILDGASSPETLVKKAVENGMEALALTDHGNMFGIKKFHDAAKKHGIKPILGCEVYLAADRHSRTRIKGKKEYNHLILLAKNEKGYKNLVRLVSDGYLEGFYSKPRIDWELLERYHEGLIASSACLAGEIPQAILEGELEKAEQLALKYKELFGEDFYLELMLHKSEIAEKNFEVYEKQKIVNEKLKELSRKYNIKLIATNDVHFANKEDAEAHDHLIAINTGAFIDEENRLRYTQQEYLKTADEMLELFGDIPEALENTQEIVEKVEVYELNHDPIMPTFPLPEGFEKDEDYLRHLVWEGAKERYGENMSEEVRERIQFELDTIIGMGFPGYFIIVWDFIKKAREMGVSVGPGRGSAAGSAVAYCLGITQIDPVRYGLLFERFLNPERISMPDIDVDFDDEGRDNVLRYVAEKYGEYNVAHLITFGTMAAKMAIRDVARVRRLPLSMANKLAKMVGPNQKIGEVKEFVEEKKKSAEVAKVLEIAEKLEGSVRQTGIHACGVIIGKEDLRNYIPLKKDSDITVLNVTQYEGVDAEACGMLKMDFLGLKTLSIIKRALELARKKDPDLDIDKIPLDDEQTYELFSKGNTIGVFQFESDGMRKYLKQLKPNRLEDLIAMNALYRPGPMEYIPNYINRKFGKEEITYDIPVMEKYLKETYGITVYQEQLMLLSQELAGFSKGQADTLRKAMGKKKKELMAKLKEDFMKGAVERGHDKKILEKIWGDWEKFASYAFNKSHSTCYAYVAYQTGYLKAHYPAEFYVAVFNKSKNDIDSIKKFISDAKHNGIKVLGPDVNESDIDFSLNEKGEIRFGLNAIKDVGENAAKEIIEERERNGKYKDIFDFVERVKIQIVNKKNLEALAEAGAFDGFGIDRYKYSCSDDSGKSFIEILIEYSNNYQQNKESASSSLFGDVEEVRIKKPEIPNDSDSCKKPDKVTKLSKEANKLGLYLSDHPLDEYKPLVEEFSNGTLEVLEDVEDFKNQRFHIFAFVTEAKKKKTRNDKVYVSLDLEDFHLRHTLPIFNDLEKLNLTDLSRIENKVVSIEFSVENFKNQKGVESAKVVVERILTISEFMKNYSRELYLYLPIDALNENLLNKFRQLKTMKNGGIKTYFLVYNGGKEKLKMSYTDKTFAATSEFILYLKELEENFGVKYKFR
jgi:DNA polymerase-3 subunit alpha